MKLWTLITVVSATLGLKKECPGNAGQECPDTATCCELLNKTYGCCPLENAVCCDDHIHCCPANTRCSTGLCVNSDFENVTATTYSVVRKDVVCPGGKYACPNGNTCCESSQPGEYSCCPIEDGICCSDHAHCCPHNTVCDLKRGTCSPKKYTTDIFNSKKKFGKKADFIKMSALTKISEREDSVVCPDGSSQCPNGYTCCMLPSGEYGCCPFTNAVCCPDKLHCCPESMTCDPTSSSCSQGGRNVSAALKRPAQEIQKVNVICPDGMHCAETMTCCALGGGHFGCCPFVDAVCCEDHSHCCPQNFTCNVKQQRCDPS